MSGRDLAKRRLLQQLADAVFHHAYRSSSRHNSCRYCGRIGFHALRKPRCDGGGYTKSYVREHHQKQGGCWGLWRYAKRACICHECREMKFQQNLPLVAEALAAGCGRAAA